MARKALKMVPASPKADTPKVGDNSKSALRLGDIFAQIIGTKEDEAIASIHIWNGLGKTDADRIATATRWPQPAEKRKGKAPSPDAWRSDWYVHNIVNEASGPMGKDLIGLISSLKGMKDKGEEDKTRLEQATKNLNYLVQRLHAVRSIAIVYAGLEKKGYTVELLASTGKARKVYKPIHITEAKQPGRKTQNHGDVAIPTFCRIDLSKVKDKGSYTGLIDGIPKVVRGAPDPVSASRPTAFAEQIAKVGTAFNSMASHVLPAAEGMLHYLGNENNTALKTKPDPKLASYDTLRAVFAKLGDWLALGMETDQRASWYAIRDAFPKAKTTDAAKPEGKSGTVEQTATAAVH